LHFTQIFFTDARTFIAFVTLLRKQFSVLSFQLSADCASQRRLLCDEQTDH